MKRKIEIINSSGDLGSRVESVWNKRFVEIGDTVFLWRGNKQLPQRLVIAPGKHFCNDVGVFNHEDIVGKQYGTRIYPNRSKSQVPKLSTKKRGRRQTPGFMYILPFSPELCTQTMPHRTQILYSTDISLITSHLHLRPGSRVGEAGTGSGSLTTAIARTISPNGHLDTYEFNEARYKEANADFEELGLSSVVSIHLRDVCTDGFGEHTHGNLDALFLDLPKPWKAIKFAQRSLKAHARICTFSPCIEQVQRTYTALENYGFYNIDTFECLRKEYKLSKLSSPTPRCFIDENQGTETKSSKLNLPRTGDEASWFRTGKEVISTLASRPFGEMAGHTGYLTFAYK